ncbi:MAG: tRNA dihydrouridine(16) synthase DusC, partial [Polaromonas sp.]|nr:tRNA dihydrouridine(16) synthase DusC [Polaromonas sp.]
RLKQWLNFLRRRFPEAETAYQSLKTINDPALIDRWLAGLLRAQAQVHPGRDELVQAA